MLSVSISRSRELSWGKPGGQLLPRRGESQIPPTDPTIAFLAEILALIKAYIHAKISAENIVVHSKNKCFRSALVQSYNSVELNICKDYYIV